MSGPSTPSGPSGPPDPDELAARLHSAAIHLLRRVREVDAESGLTASRLSALSVLVFGGPRTLGRLAAAEQVTSPSMSRLVSHLERQGLVTREAHPDDGRAVRVAATAEGRRLLEEGRSRRVRAVRGLLEGLEPAEREALGRALQALERALADGASGQGPQDSPVQHISQKRHS